MPLRIPSSKPLFRIGAALVMASSLSGCLAAIPIATTLGTQAMVNNSVDRTMDHALQVSQMNCSQLRAEWQRLDSNRLGQFSPLGNWATRRSSVRAEAANKGCSLPS